MANRAVPAITLSPDPPTVSVGPRVQRLLNGGASVGLVGLATGCSATADLPAFTDSRDSLGVAALVMVVAALYLLLTVGRLLALVVTMAIEVARATVRIGLVGALLAVAVIVLAQAGGAI